MFGSSNVTQSGLRNLYEVNLSASVHERCLGVETISSEIFKSKLSSDVIKELNQLSVTYQNAGGAWNILIGLNHYTTTTIIQPLYNQTLLDCHVCSLPKTTSSAILFN